MLFLLNSAEEKKSREKGEKKQKTMSAFYVYSNCTSEALLLSFNVSLPLSLSLILPETCTRVRAHVHQYQLRCMRALLLSPSRSRTFRLAGGPVTYTHTHTYTHFPLAVLLCFVRINEKSSLALGVISVLGVK